MLKQRVLTALVLAPLALLAVFFLPRNIFDAVLALIFLYAGWEWSNLCRLNTPGRLGYVILHAGLLALVALLPALLPVTLVLALLFWLAALVLVKGYPGTAARITPRLKLLMGVLVLVPAWQAITALRAGENGLILLLMLLMLVWGADIGAYAAGRTWGRRKLLPAVSPGKTLEGAAGGLAACVLIGAVFAFWLKLSPSGSVFLILLSLFTGMVSVLGDLLESMLKRERGIKDSGQLLPGHGGMLDRIDSLTAAAPVFLAGLHVITGV